MNLRLTLSILPRLRLRLRLTLSIKVRLGLRLSHDCRLSCCVAGNCDLAVKETDVKETLELLGERLGFPQPQAEWAPWVPSDHPLAYVETALRWVCNNLVTFQGLENCCPQGFLMVSHVLLLDSPGVSGCPAKADNSSTLCEVQSLLPKMTPSCSDCRTACWRK